MNENLSFLTKYFSLNELEIVDEYSMEIKNPYNGENICILDESYEDYYQITVYFSYQHRHMYDEQKIIEYINDIVNGNVFAIEFF